jgi:hypothetical protein
MLLVFFVAFEVVEEDSAMLVNEENQKVGSQCCWMTKAGLLRHSQ